MRGEADTEQRLIRNTHRHTEEPRLFQHRMRGKRQHNEVYNVSGGQTEEE